MPPKPAQAIQDLVDNAIKGRKVVVFSKSTCPACNTAKEVLKKYNLSKEDYKVIEIDKRPNMGEVQNYLQRITKARTVPRVFINQKCIGGASDTEYLHESGKLKTIFEKAGLTFSNV